MQSMVARHDDGNPAPIIRRLRVVPDRPATRGDCEDAPRPCPYVGCNYNLFLDVDPAYGRITLNGPDSRDPADVDPEWSCALDVADRGAQRREDIARALDVVPERIRQIHVAAIGKMRNLAGPELRALLDQLESSSTETHGEAAEREGEHAGQRWADDPHAWRRGDSIYRGVDEAEARDDAEQWSNEVVALVRAGASLDAAWRAANAETPDGVTDALRAERARTDWEEMNMSEETSALIAQHQQTNEKLRARLRALLEEAAAIEREIGLEDDEEKRPRAAPSAPPGPPRAPAKGSLVEHIVAWLHDHPGSTTGEIAEALETPSRDIARVLFSMGKRGQIVALGERGTRTWKSA